MTTINDIQDLVQIIEDRPEWRRELQRVLLTPDLSDTASLIAETAKLVAENAKGIEELKVVTAENAELNGENAKGIEELKVVTAENAKGTEELKAVTAENAELIGENSKSIDRLEFNLAETARLVDKNTESIQKLDTSTKRLTETTRINSGHIGDMRGLFASQKVVREAALITNRMGLRFVATLEPMDIIEMWDMGEAKGLTNDISQDDEDSFKNADLTIVARTDDGAWFYVAVEISYTVDGRDTTRAIRNAEYITNFTGTPCYAAVAGVFKDNRIDEVLADMPRPYDSERETFVFWSEHEDIAKPS